MSLKDQIAAQVGGVFLKTDHFAESVSYQPAAGGSPVACSAVCIDGTELSSSGGIGSEYAGRPQKVVSVRLAASSIAAPDFNDTITRSGGAVLRVRQVLTAEGMHTLTCTTNERRGSH